MAGCAIGHAERCLLYRGQWRPACQGDECAGLAVAWTAGRLWVPLPESPAALPVTGLPWSKAAGSSAKPHCVMPVPIRAGRGRTSASLRSRRVGPRKGSVSMVTGHLQVQLAPGSAQPRPPRGRPLPSSSHQPCGLCVRLQPYGRHMGQNGLISTVRVGKIDPFRFISSESVIKCAVDSCVGNIFCYNVFHLPGAGVSGRSLSPCLL